MNDNPQEPDALSRWVHYSLLVGLLLSGLLLIMGLGIVFIAGQFPVEPITHSLLTLLRMALSVNGEAILALGILVLLLTPVIRVLVLAVGWTLRRERRMALVALVVLALLATSILLGVG